MESPLLQSTHFEIGGVDYQIGLLSFEDARPTYVKLQRLLSANDDDLTTFGNGLFMFATYAGVLTDDDLKWYIEMFGKTTQVQYNEKQRLFLKDKLSRDLLFMGRMDDMFLWLDACVEANFKVAAEKLRAARQRLVAAVAAKAAAKELAEAEAKTKS